MLNKKTSIISVAFLILFGMSSMAKAEVDVGAAKTFSKK